MTTKNRKQYMAQLMPGILALLTVMALVALLLGGMAALRPGSEPELTTDPTVGTTVAPSPEPNPYGPEDFVYEGDFLTCAAGESILGIDVSTFQDSVDWEAVKEAGVEFVFIRLGYRGYETGKINMDNRCLEHYAGAKAAGLKIGAYFYSQAITVQEAVAEAEFALEIIQDWQLDLPVVYDWEYVSADARTGNMDARLLTDCTLAFCRRVELAGHRPMIYFNTTQARDLLYLSELRDYPFWLAQYNDGMDFPYRVEMWQYTSRGSVPGIQGDVDLNLWLP